MTRSEKIAEARRRVAAGEVPRVVAADLGVGRSTIYQWVYPERYSEARPERAAQKRAWEREHDRGVCPCGARTGIGSRRRGYALCDACNRESLAAGRAMREERIAEMWAQGLTLREIADALGSTAPSIGRSMAAMRERGWDLPYRHNWSEGSLENIRNAARARRAA